MATNSKLKNPYDVAKSASRIIWPGCGDGRCMPCGGVHDFSYESYPGGPLVHRIQCMANHHFGCPFPKPEPSHENVSRGRCDKCKARIKA